MKRYIYKIDIFWQISLVILTKILLAIYHVIVAQLVMKAFSQISIGFLDINIFFIMIFMGGVYGLAMYIGLIYEKKLQNRLSFSISNYILYHTIYGKQKSQKIGDLLIRITQDAEIASNYIKQYFIPIMEFVLTCGIAIFFISMQFWIMGLIYLIMGFLYFILARKFYIRVLELAEKISKTKML